MLFSFGLFFISFAQILVNVLPAIQQRNLIDFTVYFGALEKFIDHQNPYHYLYSQPYGAIPFNYPPSALIVLFPFKLLPIKIGEMILVFLSFISLWFSLWITLKLTKIKIFPAHFLLILAFFNQTFPVKLTLILGQINLLVLGLSFTAFFLYSGEFCHLNLFRVSNLGLRILSAVLFSFASSLKIFPLFTLPLFLILKDFSFVFWVLLIFTGLNFLASPNLTWQYYLQIVPNISKAINKPLFYDQSLLAFFLRWGLDPQIAKISVFFIIAGLFILMMYNYYKNYNSYYRYLLSFALVFALFSVGNIFSWQHHLVFSYPLILLFYLDLWKGRKKLGWKFFLIVFILWGLLVFHFPNENSIFLKNPLLASYQTILILFMIILSCLKSFRLRSFWPLLLH